MAERKREQDNVDRQALAEKLDNELDEHMQKVIEKNKNYKFDSGITLENFEEKVKQIPAFTNKAPTQEDIDASPALQALQSLKYEDEDPAACALAHKEDGNYHFQKKDYRQAVSAYTEGLKQKHDDANLMAILYTNRAAANSHLGNNRSALNDATFALKHKPDHMKAIIRATVTCFDLERYQDCVTWCEKGLKVNPEETKLKDYKKKATLQKKQKERDQRKKEMKQFKDLKIRTDLISALTSRGITVIGDEDETNESKIERLLFDRSPRSGKIVLDENQHLHWPLHLLYPEYNQSDSIEDMNENHRLVDHLEVVFSQPAEWDAENSYTMKNIEVFFEDHKRALLIRVDTKITLKELLSDNRYRINGDCPVLMVLSKVTDFYAKTFENQEFEDF